MRATTKTGERQFKSIRELYRALLRGELRSIEVDSVVDLAQDLPTLSAVLVELRTAGVELNISTDPLLGEHLLGCAHALASVDRARAVASAVDSFTSSQGGRPRIDVDREAIVKLLAKPGMNKTRAAERLGISIQTLRRRLREDDE